MAIHKTLLHEQDTHTPFPLTAWRCQHSGHCSLPLIGTRHIPLVFVHQCIAQGATTEFYLFPLVLSENLSLGGRSAELA